VKKDYKLASDNLKEKKKIFAPLEKTIQTIKQKVTVLGNTIRAKVKAHKMYIYVAIADIFFLFI
jgi:hypothetical protein